LEFSTLCFFIAGANISRPAGNLAGYPFACFSVLKNAQNHEIVSKVFLNANYATI
jgi:hypothetical protein